MKNVFRLLILAAVVASFTLPAFAQDTSTSAAAPSAQDIQAKADLYAKFLKEKAGDAASQKQASQTGQEYVSKYGAAADEAVKKASTDAEKSAAEADKRIVDYIRGWVGKYEKAVRDFACTDAFDKNDYAKAFSACQAILNEQPDNIDTVLLLARSGYLNVVSPTPNKGLNSDAARLTRRAIELLESGKSPTKWEPFPSREEAIGFLQYTLGLVTQETSPADASAAFIKVAQSNSTFKTQPATFTYLANIYEVSELKKLVDQYAAAFPPNVPIPDEKKPQYDQMLAQIGKVQDRIIDAYARAAALMKSDPKYTSDPKLAAFKKDVMNKLTAYYKQRHEGSPDTEIQELVNNVLSRPIPIPGQEPATPVAPAASSGMNGTVGTATTPVGQPVANPSTPAANTAPKPAATTTTAPASTTPKPKPISKKATPAVKSSRASKTTSGR